MADCCPAQLSLDKNQPSRPGDLVSVVLMRLRLRMDHPSKRDSVGVSRASNDLEDLRMSF